MNVLPIKQAAAATQPASSPEKSPAISPFPAALRALRSVERLFDRAFGTTHNPWHNLGALSYFFYWIIAATGMYLYIVFDTGVLDAFRSVEAITRQWYFGGVIRSLHRYASDAFVVTMTAHLLREFLHGHFANFRWFSWVSGVPLLWLVIICGINGYWLVWDQLAQFIAVGTAELLDWLPVFGGAMVRNFLTPETISDRFFSLLVFMHIGLPLLLLAGMWIHIQRISRARSKPPRALGWGTMIALLVLSLVEPAISAAPANMMTAPAELSLDWFYLTVYPLLYAWTPGQVWALLGGGTVLLFLVPAVFRRKRAQVAVVDLPNCNGCGRCVSDCPYSAVTMQPRTDGARFAMEAVVNSDLCASCGICAGACPSSTPFRSIGHLVTGIDMPQRSVQALRTELETALRSLDGDKTKVLVFGCDCAAQVSGLAREGVAAVSLLCTGQLPPSFIEFALRNGADGVLLTGCHEGACEFRLGPAWARQRVEGEREPHLRRNNFDMRRVRMSPASVVETHRLSREIDAFREELQHMGTQPETAATEDQETRHG
ncbi:MAG TPA: hydrogenase iron-sulfur subunit [Noviherbaspirillum sp.]|uniref:hydrogenase iron-sulfur subunit n=1 Tax=Noviherbaspirillum sp. TaxID=1926288 RepID=UPI002B4A27C2|nr:hydrogenase iron-sulfur subunit [Noviherbaspirillum sp.]HJV84276.1 hydrogenase iron-sulfur subunit [Noviherbaspirillum sp.]